MPKDQFIDSRRQIEESIIKSGEKPQGGSAADAASRHIVDIALQLLVVEDYHARRSAASMLSKMGRDGQTLLQVIQDAEARDDRAKIATALKTVASRTIDITFPAYKTISQFVNDLLKLNPVPRRPDDTPHAPSEAERQLTAVVDRINAFRQEATGQLQDALNAYLQAQRPESYQDKQRIAETVTSSLEPLAAAIRYKDQPCYLSATTSGAYPTGRFMLVPKGSKTPLLTRVNLSDFLPLELTAAPPRREGLKEWYQRVKASPPGEQESGRNA